MKLTINYFGDLGDGSISVEMDELSTIDDLLDVFHNKIDCPRTYQLRGGAPPYRSTFDVEYDYDINQISINHENEKDSLVSFDIKDQSTITINVGGGDKVD